MYEKVSLKTIMILVTTAILIVPWAALPALARAVGSCQYRPGRAQPGARAVGSSPLVWSDELARRG